MAVRQVDFKPKLPSIKQIARTVELLDQGARVRIIPFRLPLDPILGLIPLLGDTITLLISGSIILHARRLGAPLPAQRKMIANIAVDYLFGNIPIVGDLFDFYFKANIKNLHLLNKHLASIGKDLAYIGGPDSEHDRRN